ncbi:MAG TPA: histidinol-phosphate transaminase [Bryobacteraceae bacterium]|jgi:histidinol-phosphate aminotransferase|nr:histidinol-phosphate transaminase [Bryobacteraceae bacterium]
MNRKDVSAAFPAPSQRTSEMPHYVRSEISLNPGVELIQLSRNESAIAMQPAWMDAAMEAARSSGAYPDPECNLLRKAIAETFCLDGQRIVCSAGLMECLQTIALAYLGPGDKVVIPEHAFVFFRQVAKLAGAEVNLVDEHNLRIDISQILDAVDESTKMVIFANPGNPTGTYLCRPCIAQLRSRLPSNTLLVIDEAYAEFVQEDRYQPLFDLTDAGNVIVLRSFSKMYGLAGLRVGWAYCPPDAVDFVRRIQVPAIVGSVAQAVAAVAVRDQALVHSFKQEMLLIKRHFIERLKGLPRISAVESETNFVLLRTKSEMEALNLDEFLRQRGIILRRQMAVGLGECLRATIGTKEQMNFVASVIVEWCRTGEA